MRQGSRLLSSSYSTKRSFFSLEKLFGAGEMQVNWFGAGVLSNDFKRFSAPPGTGGESGEVGPAGPELISARPVQYWGFLSFGGRAYLLSRKV